MRTVTTIVIFTLAVLGATGGWQWSHRRAIEEQAEQLTGGDAKRGRALMVRYGCVACHVAPGFPGTNPRVGPPLASFALSHYVAGVAENTPENLVRFIADPRSVAPKSAMPNVGVSPSDTRDLAAFLYTLQ